jgi:hypothetical protein
MMLQCLPVASLLLVLYIHLQGCTLLRHHLLQNVLAFHDARLQRLHRPTLADRCKLQTIFNRSCRTCWPDVCMMQLTRSVVLALQTRQR